MADEDRDQDGPSLELPSFGFGRKRRNRDDSAPNAADDTVTDPGSDPASEQVDETQPMPATSVEPTPAPAPVPPAPVPSAVWAPAPVPEAPVAPPLFVDEAAARPETEQQPAPRPEQQPAVASASVPAEPSTPTRRLPQLPAIGGPAAAVVTGLIVGVLTVGLTWASLSLCDAVKGTSSCGNPGYLLLVAILIAMVLVGSSLLRAWSVPDAGSTSLLAVGLLAVFVLLFLVDALGSWTMLLVIPLVTAAAYALSHWVTGSISEAAEG